MVRSSWSPKDLFLLRKRKRALLAKSPAHPTMEALAGEQGDIEQKKQLKKFLASESRILGFRGYGVRGLGFLRKTDVTVSALWDPDSKANHGVG